MQVRRGCLVRAVPNSALRRRSVCCFSCAPSRCCACVCTAERFVEAKRHLLFRRRRLGKVTGAGFLMLQISGVGRQSSRIGNVTPLVARMVQIEWEGQFQSQVDLMPILANHRSYAALRHDDELFMSIRVSSDLLGIEWRDGSRVSAATILKLPTTTMTASEFRAIMDELRFSVEGLSALLGLSKRAIADYRSGQIIPKPLALAMRYLQERGSI